jgi:hypothetical protein
MRNNSSQEFYGQHYTDYNQTFTQSKKKRSGSSMHTSKKNTVSTAVSGANANVSDLKKSVGMLQAYGEY